MPLLILLLLSGLVAAQDAPPLRLLALGDSYTIGEGVDPAQRWPSLLVGRLRAEGQEFAEPEIVARTGWTTNDLLAALADRHEAPAYDLVSLQIGVNDQFRGGNVDAYRPQVRAALVRAVTFAGGRASRVLAVSIPDYGVTPFARGRDAARIATALDAFNAAFRVESEAIGARWIDVTPASRLATDDRGLIARDGLHPSPSQYALWVAEIAPLARLALAP